MVLSGYFLCGLLSWFLFVQNRLSISRLCSLCANFSERLCICWFMGTIPVVSYSRLLGGLCRGFLGCLIFVMVLEEVVSAVWSVLIVGVFAVRYIGWQYSRIGRHIQRYICAAVFLLIPEFLNVKLQKFAPTVTFPLFVVSMLFKVQFVVYVYPQIPRIVYAVNVFAVYVYFRWVL